MEDFRKTHFSLSVEFKNLDELETEKHSISLNIRGQQRDWVFVAAVDIEERLEKTKLTTFRPTSRTILSLASITALAPLVIIMATLSGSHVDFDSMSNRDVKNLNELAAIQIEIAKSKQPNFPMLPYLMPIVGVSFLLTFLATALRDTIVWKRFRDYFLCQYGFYWVGSVATIDKQNERLKYLVNSIVVAFLISVVAGFVPMIFQS